MIPGLKLDTFQFIGKLGILISLLSMQYQIGSKMKNQFGRF